ncbi:phage portal protein%2C HK97 family [uncultured Clostridium sp.]|uniref:phage portal protein n=1 Tax=uncultured Clostridium sp. TaxID=59620 RepID=UPI000822F094|nr:phage portal protein [uncultured Clostridium sp.]SCJ09442.1 phage portal protein%2C HK97 family [uncultured Clostridium sp.]
MFEKLFEKRNYIGENPFDWTSFIKGEDDDFTGNDSTYSKCINLFSENIAKLPIVTKIKSEKGDIDADSFYLYELLRLRPNPSMNAFECIKALVAMTKHYGSAGLYIDRQMGTIRGLYPVRINQFIVDNAGLISSTKENKVLVDFTCGDVSGSCFEKDIIILRDNSINGINFRKTRTYIRDSIDTNIKAQKYQAQLFSNGLTNKIVVQLTSDIKDEKELKKTQKKFDKMYSNNGRVFTVPAGYNVSAMNLSLADSQFAELKVIGKQDITSAIGVPYSLIEKGSLTEEETIAFLSNAIIPIITALEQEMDWKLLTSTDRKNGYKIRFNVNAMLRTSPEKQSIILDRYVKDGIYTINDAKRILGVPLVDGGDIVTLPSGQVTLENLIAGKATWQKESTTKGGDNDENGENQD